MSSRVSILESWTPALAIVPEQLFPVSGVAKTGTGVTLLPLYTGEATSTSLSGIVQCLEEGKDATVCYGSVDFKFRNDNEFDIKYSFFEKCQKTK